MMSCLGGSRSYTIPHIRPPTPKLLPQSESKTIVASSSAPAISETKNSNICLPKPVKKRRTRRGRPRDSYTKAIAAFYTIYPRIFPEEGDVCPLVKIEPRSPAEKTELLQELPALLSKLREAEEELPLILSNFNRVDSPSPSPSPSLSKLASGSPEFDDESEEGGLREESCEVESFLEATDIEGGMDTILGRPMVGASASASATAIQLPEQRHPDVVDPTAYVSAIRGRRRCLDGVADGGVWNGQMRRLRFKDKLKAEKEMNAMSFCSLDWLKRDEPPRKLSLQLDYEQVRNAWSGRGSLFIEDGHCPNTDDEDDYDSASYALENVDIGLVPDVSFWRGHVEECSNVNVNISYPIEDGCRTVEEDVERKTGIREARVLRYKEKRQTRLFSKKIRYEVRKLNAEKRPRMKGRFVKRELD